jgi:importin-5
MSQLPAEAQKPLVDLLQALQATDNTVRSKAEEQLNNEWFIDHADWLLVGLAEQIQSAQETQVWLSVTRDNDYALNM